MRAMTIGIYPEAWAKLTGQSPQTLANRTTADLPDWLATLAQNTTWEGVQNGLEQLWQKAQNPGNIPLWTGPQRLADWGKWLTVRAATSGPGQSLRAAERRLRRWTGQTRQSLQFYAKIEHLHQLSATQNATPAAMAHDAGFADQSHMGRAVKRATGLSPAELNRRIASEESFWCYRLRGVRF
jgi:AraC-like DNA-binding protein